MKESENKKEYRILINDSQIEKWQRISGWRYYPEENPNYNNLVERYKKDDK